MKINLSAALLALAVTTSGLVAAQTQAAPQPQPAPAAQAAPAAAAAPVIKDPAEYNAYMGAIQQKDPNAKISGLEAFLVQYPNSIVKNDAMESLMGAYQQAGNMEKLTDSASRLLAASPDNVRALFVLAYLDRANGKWADGVQHGTHGLDSLGKMTKPEGMSDADFEKQKKQMASVFNGTAGFSAFQLKNYPDAQKYLRAAVQSDPNDVQNVYPLALAYLTAAPPVYNDGLFFIARAANIAPPAGEAQIENYGKSVYTKYHGSDQGWTDVMATAKTAPEPPAGFTVTQYVPPTPAEQCTEILKTKQPKDMSFAEWQLCLSSGTPEDSDKVWTAIKGKALQMEGTVMKVSSTEVEVAGSQDDIDQKRADIVVTMTGPIPARLMPKVDGVLDFEGTPVSFTPNPFVMTMDNGALLTKAAPAAKKAPVHHAAPKK